MYQLTNVLLAANSEKTPFLLEMLLLFAFLSSVGFLAWWFLRSVSVGLSIPARRQSNLTDNDVMMYVAYRQSGKHREG